MARARANPEVVAALGEPIESGLLISGSINVEGSGGNVDVSIPISGPKGSGTLYVVGTRIGRALAVLQDGGRGPRPPIAHRPPPRAP